MNELAGNSWDRLTKHWRTNGVALIGAAIAADEIHKLCTGKEFSPWWFVMGIGQFLGFATMGGDDPRKEKA